MCADKMEEMRSFRGAKFLALLFSIQFLPAVSFLTNAAETGGILRVLFLGDNGHHRPADRFKQIQPEMAKRGIELVYTDKMGDINEGKLAGYDSLIIFANTTVISP